MLRARDPLAESTGARSTSGAKALRQGLLSDLGNPKIAVFFTSFLPQFVHGGAVFLPLLVLGGLFAVLTLAWLAAYALLIGRSSALLRRPGVRKVVDRATGVVLIAFGVRLALEHRSDGRLGVVLDVAAHLAGAFDRVQPRHQVQRHVDAGRHTGGRDDSSGVDEALVPHVDAEVA